MTNQIFCDLCREHRAGRLSSFRWFGSHHTHVDLGHTHLVPDALILFPSPSRAWWMYFLELDRHTMSMPALAEKFERYALMQRIASTRADDPVWEARAGGWVVFACGDDRRASAVMDLAAAYGLDRIWAGTAETCAGGLAAVIGPESGEFIPAIQQGPDPAASGWGIAPPRFDDAAAAARR